MTFDEKQKVKLHVKQQGRRWKVQVFTVSRVLTCRDDGSFLAVVGTIEACTKKIKCANEEFPEMEVESLARQCVLDTLKECLRAQLLNNAFDLMNNILSRGVSKRAFSHIVSALELDLKIRTTPVVLFGKSQVTHKKFTNL